MPKKIVVESLLDRDGMAVQGIKAEVTPGVSIRLFGTKPYPQGNEPDDVQFDRLFSLGDQAEYGSYNLTYYGSIVSITPRMVVIEERWGDGNKNKRHHMSLYKFAKRNWNFDLREVEIRNAETSRHI